jgi:hypothetical protein
MDRSVYSTTYPEYTPDPKSWRAERPAFDVDRFNKDLERRGGCIGSIPRYRVVWGGNNPDYIVDEILKHTGYTYIVDGQEHFVSNKNVDFEFPDNALLINPFHEDFKAFLPRWIVEQYKADSLGYEKAWIVQEMSKELTDGEGGRIDCISYYREPSEIDLQMAEKLTYLNLTLNQDDIRNGLAEIEALKQRAEARKKAEFVDEIAHEFAKGFTDGIEAKPIHFDYGKSFDIRKYTDKKLEEFTAKAETKI